MELIDEKKMVPVIMQARELVVRSEGELTRAKETVLAIKGLKEEISNTFDPIISAAHKAHKEAVAQKKKYIEPLESAESQIKRRMADYYDIVEENRRIEEARAREEAEKQRQAEIAAATKKLNALLAKSSKLDDQLIEVEAELNNPDLTDMEREVLLVQQSQLLARIDLANSKAQEKQANIQTAIETPLIIKTETESPKVSGVATGTTLIPEVFNMMALCKAVVSGGVPMTVLTPDMSVIKKLVNAGMHIPGIATTQRRSIRVGGQR